MMNQQVLRNEWINQTSHSHKIQIKTFIQNLIYSLKRWMEKLINTSPFWAIIKILENENKDIICRPLLYPKSVQRGRFWDIFRRCMCLFSENNMTDFWYYIKDCQKAFFCVCRTRKSKNRRNFQLVRNMWHMK